MADDIRLMTYAELAIALGIGPDSARNLVRRRRWGRKQGNDGLSRIEVPIEHLAARDKPDTPADGSADPPVEGTTGPPADIPAIVLERHIERLERDLAAAVAERDVERARAAQVGVLKAVLEAEQRRAVELRDERDKWQGAATAPRGMVSWWLKRMA